MKKLLSLLLTLMMLASVVTAAIPSSAAVSDPSANYTVQTAPFEDSDIQMWFNHANVKVHQEDTTSTGRNTYSVYMAKNEYQGTQVTLYSPSVTKSNISANVTEFTAMDGSGATMSADVYYEYYINCTNLDSTDVLGVNSASESFIREGMIPDAMAKIEEINASKRERNPDTGKMETVATKQFTLTAGKTQTLYIKIKSELDTPSGWYSGQFNVLDSYGGNVIKTATVYAYVWNFEIPEAVHYQTAFHINRGDYNNLIPNDMYKAYYDYLLDNRICAFIIPGELNSENEYLTNPRVTAFSVSAPGSYLSYTDSANAAAIYEELSGMAEWDTIKDKAYFYIADEPRSLQQKYYNSSVSGSPTVDDCIARSQAVNNGWPDANILVVVDENHPYVPGGTQSNPGYSETLAWDGTKYLTADDGTGRFSGVSDAIQGLIDSDAVNLWCIKSMMMTPRDVTQALGFNGAGRIYKVRNMNGIISGFNCSNVASYYFDWDSIYGPFSERFAAYQSNKLQNENKKVNLWWYECGKGPDYTYCNHLIENTGLQTELLFWQSMQVGATGYLYYGATYWNEFNSDVSYASGSSRNYDGTTVDGKWGVNRQQNIDTPGTYRYGNGNIMYGKDVKTSIYIDKKDEPLGTIRVELIRDGIEDYEMLYQYREKFGEAAMNAMIEKVSSNVVDYLSMPSFNRSAYSSTMTDEDVFAAVRVELGNALDSADAPAPHTHIWNDGVVTKEPTYTATGVKTYTCTECGETRTEEIPVLDPKPGDVNGDYSINALDVENMKLLLGGGSTSDVVLVNCDLDHDSSYTAMDLDLLKSLLAS